MIDDHKSMTGLTPEQQARKALEHILNRVCSHPHVGFYLGCGTEGFALATEALAALTGSDVLAVRKAYEPENPRDPVKDATDRIRCNTPDNRAALDAREARALSGAAAMLEEIARAEALAAATTTQHDGYERMLKSERADNLAWMLKSMKSNCERWMP